MSLLVNWKSLTAEHSELCRTLLQESINNNLQLPEQLMFLRVDQFSFGSQGPQIEIVDMSDPMLHFYPQLAGDINTSSGAFYESRLAGTGETSSERYGDRAAKSIITDHSSQASSSSLSDLQIPDMPLLSDNHPVYPSSSDPLDTQITFALEYTGDMSIQLSTELSLINKPVQGFLSLPVKFRVCSVKMKCLLSVCYLNSSRKVMITILNSPPSKNVSSSPTKPSSTGIDNNPSENSGCFEFELKTEWEVGDEDRQPVLKNAVKIERFLNDVIVKMLTDRVCFPHFITMDLHPGAGDGINDGEFLDDRGID